MPYVICFLFYEISSFLKGAFIISFQTYPLNTVFDVTDLVNISYYKLPKRYEFPGESHEFWELLYVDRGELTVAAGDSAFCLKAGEMVFHCPFEFHSFRVTGQDPVNVIVISFYCQSVHMRRFEHRILFLHQAEKQCLTALVAESAAAYIHFDNEAPRVDLRKKDTAPFGSDQLIRAGLEQLLIHCRRRDDNISIRNRAVATNQQRNCERITAQARAYLDAHLSEKITLEQLAETLGISLSHLKRVFKEQTGRSVMAYLTDQRISEAKRLIRQDNDNFTQVGAAVGYESIYYFSALFKKQTGMTLTEYARSVRP